MSARRDTSTRDAGRHAGGAVRRSGTRGRPLLAVAAGVALLVTGACEGGVPWLSRGEASTADSAAAPATGASADPAARGTAQGADEAGTARDPGADGRARDGRDRRQDARLVNVRVRTLEPTGFVDRIHLTGTARARRRVELAADAGGRIEALFVEKGDRVEEGQLLARIEARQLRAELKQARARAALARETWERRKRLYEEEQAISKLSYLEAKFGAEEAEGRVEALEARLDRTTVEAPFAGVVDARPVEIGTRVAPGDPVATLVQVRPLEVAAGVPERYAADIAVGDSAEVTFRLLDGEPLRGALTFVGASVSPDSRTFPVELSVPNPDLRVKPEMVASISLVRRRLTDVIVVPQDAVLRTEDGFAVYVVEETEEGPVARRRAVEPGPRERDRVVVEEGLAAGDRLIVLGHQQVAEGDPVRILDGR